MTAEDDLRDRLRALAERAGRPSADGPGLARRIARDSAERRRSRRNVLAGLACVALLVAAVPQLVDSGAPEAVPASEPVSAPAPDVAVGATAVPRDVRIVDLPTRGSLAGDAAFLDGVRALPWSQEQPHPLPDPPRETRSVVFAGEVSGGRWALVVGRGSGQPRAAWFTGPADAGPGEMELRSGPTAVSPARPLAATDPRTGSLVVVAAPGDIVEVSARPVITADGRTTREWREVETVHGVAITHVPPFPRPWDASTSYRVLRHGLTEARDMPWSLAVDQAVPPVPIGYPRGRPSELGERAARFAAEHVLAELGLSAAQVEATAQWVGSVPAGGAGQGAVVSVTLPSGAVVVEARVVLPEQPDGGRAGSFCGHAILPAGAPAARRVQAVACEVADPVTGEPVGTSLVVVGPPEVALIRTYDDDRVFLTEHAAAGGVLVVPLPPGTDTVEAVTGGGVVLGRVELLGHVGDFGD